MSIALLQEALNTYSKQLHKSSEELDVATKILDFIIHTPGCFDRIPGGHVTSSAWILNYDKTHVLLTHHKKLNKWLQLGGHNDGTIDCALSALKEAQEESGIQNYIFLMPDIFDVDIHSIPNACAIHYDVRYVLQAPKDTPFMVSDESYNLAWVPLQEVAQYSNERSLMRMVEKTYQLFGSTF